MSFAAAEARANASVLARLANADAVIALPADVAGQVLSVIFDAAYQQLDIGSGMASSSPAATLAESDIPASMVAALANGSDVSLVIRGVSYTVVEPQPDGTGLTVLRLRR